MTATVVLDDLAVAVRANTTPVGPADGDIRVETLEVTDAVRWLREWHVVMGVHRTAWGVYLRLLQPDTGVWRTVFYRPGVWVAARARRRDELPA